MPPVEESGPLDRGRVCAAPASPPSLLCSPIYIHTRMPPLSLGFKGPLSTDLSSKIRLFDGQSQQSALTWPMLKGTKL